MLKLTVCLVLNWFVLLLTGLLQVEHFSKYKLQTDDSDEEEEGGGGGGGGEEREGVPKRVKVGPTAVAILPLLKHTLPM